MNAIQITGSNPQADGTWKVGYNATYEDSLHIEGFVYVPQEDMDNMRMRDLPDYVSNKIVSELSKGSPSIDSVGTTDDSVTIKAE
ncbi:hypothetical protein [Lactiplantibacillus pentosus]|jgi:hypothetical protein|uniref:Uncharacterized protein n=2 Tax=Lactiplantibacillus pentosus TaxID=1589 RepID=A0AAP8VAL8_LACPE|nr:hypothetical protein [Lactiplantibacillus pentosus]ASG79314.1 hypothetical protein CEW82_05420 [Lactiplantibacillus pentosus]MBU7497553.1 hypothetical protein [Lactiplantibacillus pentosus]MBU7504154.1 hypothetical protein [Lactiplantibacillus pentosus]MCB5222852.1 hypothetical protein [Lactiplantibacillus pentosus]MCJ8184173.1 hypothetical protein [Lactiplantibacillus pentosus]